MLKHILIIPNPGSGKGKAVDYGNRLAELLKETYQAKVEVRPTTALGDAKQWSSTAVRDGFDTVICLGGDGTVSETVDGLLQNDDVPYFGFVPLGTVNDLGRVLGYDMNPDRAIEQYRDLKTVPLDIGQMNGESHFINVIAVGAVPESVMHTGADDKNKLGVFAYLRDGVKAYFNQDKYLLEIKTGNGEVRKIETNLVIIALTNSVAGIEVLIPHASYNDGLVHLIAPKGALALSTIQTLFEGGIHPQETDSMYVMADTEMTISCLSHDRVESNVDGDQGPDLPLTIKVLKHRLQAIVPA